MNKIIKKIVSAVTAVAVAVTAMVVFDVPEKITAAAAGEHTHKVCVNADNCPSCSHGNVVWTAWADSTKLPSSDGNYYLTTDVTLGYELTKGISENEPENFFGVIKKMLDNIS